MPEYRARPEKMPHPTYWPFFLALGVVMSFWGILTTFVITGMGILIFLVALSGWIANLLHKINTEDHEI